MFIFYLIIILFRSLDSARDDSASLGMAVHRSGWQCIARDDSASLGMTVHRSGFRDVAILGDARVITNPVPIAGRKKYMSKCQFFNDKKLPLMT